MYQFFHFNILEAAVEHQTGLEPKALNAMVKWNMEKWPNGLFCATHRLIVFTIIMAILSLVVGVLSAIMNRVPPTRVVGLLSRVDHVFIWRLW